MGVGEEDASLSLQTASTDKERITTLWAGLKMPAQGTESGVGVSQTGYRASGRRLAGSWGGPSQEARASEAYEERHLHSYK